MSMTDPIANFLTLMRNAIKARKESVDIPFSKVKEQIAAILKSSGYVKNVKKIDDHKQGALRIYLKYDRNRQKTPAITKLKRVSKPGLRVYKKSEEIKPVLGGIGIAIISTSKGIKTDKECRDINLGGEILCQIW